MADLTDIAEFIEIFKKSNAIIRGGEDYEEWVSQFFMLCINHRKADAYGGGILISQFGTDSGLPISFGAKNIPVDIKDETINILNDFLENPVVSLIEHDLTSQNGKNLKCMISPISYGFDRPIGYFYVICKKNDASILRQIIEYATIIVSVFVQAAKGANSLSLMAESLNDKSFNVEIDTLIEYTVEQCLKAVSCFGAACWVIEDNYLVTKYCRIGESSGFSFDMQVGKGLAGKCASSGKSKIYDKIKLNEVEHQQIVKEKKIESAIFVPIFSTNKVVGVFAVYGIRTYGFSKLDEDIVISFVSWLSFRLTQQDWIEKIAKIERQIDAEMSLIEAGIKAMERIHDAKNKLNSAQNELSFIIARFHDRQDSDTYKRASKCSNHINVVQDIISSLVERTKINKANMKRIPIQKIIEQVYQEYKSECEYIHAKTEIVNNPKAIVYVDVKLFRRVFNNLFDNAIYFLSDMVRERAIRITIECNQKEVFITFEDNGIGIQPHYLNKVFDIFHTTKGVNEGMGFGLTIAKRIIEEHNGSISVKSKWGYHTKFLITLPNYNRRFLND